MCIKTVIVSYIEFDGPQKMKKFNFYRIRVGQPTVVDVHASGRVMDINARHEGCSDESCFE